MRSLSTILSDNGERALETLKREVQSLAGAEEFVTSLAIDLAQKDDADVDAELRKSSRELVELVSRNAPTIPRHVVNGLVIGLCELVIARRREIIPGAPVPCGPAGPTGAQGPQGNTGPQGATGATGTGIPGPSPFASPIPWTGPGLVCTATAPATVVIYNDALYLCIVSHTTGGVFNGANWQLIISIPSPFSSVLVSYASRTPNAAQSNSLLQVSGNDASLVRAELNSFGGACHFAGVRYDGTLASSTAVQSGEEITTLSAWGYNGASVMGPAAAVRMYAAENWSNGHQGTYLRFSVTPIASATLTDAGMVANDGGLCWPPAVTGGSQGAGSANFSSLYIAGSLVSPSSNSNFVGDTGSGGTAGIVPAPAAGTGFKGFALAAAGSFALPLEARGFLGGLTLSNDASTPNTVLDISAGVACDSTNAALMKLASAITKSISSTWAVGSGNGGLDIGTVGASLWYFSYLIMRVDTGVVDALLSLAPGVSWTVTCKSASPAVFTWGFGTGAPFLQNGAPVVLSGTAPTGFTAGTTYYVVSANQSAGTFELAATQGGAAINSTSMGSGFTAASNPTLPTNYTLFRRIGAIKTDGSSHILAFTQYGDEFLWAVPVNDLNFTTLGTTPTLFALASVPPGVKVIARLRSYAIGSATASDVLINSPDEASTSVNAQVGNISITIPTNGVSYASGEMNIRTNASQQIRAVSSASPTDLYAAIYGFADTRGRFA